MHSQTLGNIAMRLKTICFDNARSRSTPSKFDVHAAVTWCTQAIEFSGVMKSQICRSGLDADSVAEGVCRRVAGNRVRAALSS